MKPYISCLGKNAYVLFQYCIYKNKKLQNLYLTVKRVFNMHEFRASWLEVLKVHTFVINGDEDYVYLLLLLWIFNFKLLCCIRLNLETHALWLEKNIALILSWVIHSWFQITSNLKAVVYNKRTHTVSVLSFVNDFVSYVVIPSFYKDVFQFIYIIQFIYSCNYNYIQIIYNICVQFIYMIQYFQKFVTFSSIPPHFQSLSNHLICECILGVSEW